MLIPAKTIVARGRLVVFVQDGEHGCGACVFRPATSVGDDTCGDVRDAAEDAGSASCRDCASGHFRPAVDMAEAIARANAGVPGAED